MEDLPGFTAYHEALHAECQLEIDDAKEALVKAQDALTAVQSLAPGLRALALNQAQEDVDKAMSLLKSLEDKAEIEQKHINEAKDMKLALSDISEASEGSDSDQAKETKVVEVDNKGIPCSVGVTQLLKAFFPEMLKDATVVGFVYRENGQDKDIHCLISETEKSDLAL